MTDFPTMGEETMTDYQTKLLLAALADTLNSSTDINEARARFHSITGGEFTPTESTKAKTELLQEILNPQVGGYDPNAGNMSDYQFGRFLELWDKCDEQLRELSILREENAELKGRLEKLQK